MEGYLCCCTSICHNDASIIVILVQLQCKINWDCSTKFVLKMMHQSLELRYGCGIVIVIQIWENNNWTLSLLSTHPLQKSHPSARHAHCPRSHASCADDEHTYFAITASIF